MSDNTVRIRESRYAALTEQAQFTGVPIEELVDRAISTFLQYEQFIRGLRTQIEIDRRESKWKTGR